MSSRGYIRFYRSIWTHPVFPKEAFTRREAWTWLLSKAAWKSSRVRAGDYVVDLARGEVPGAVRYLAAEWQWSKGKVERYLEMLKNEDMIETQSGTGITIITICNYDNYQGDADDDGTPPDLKLGRLRDATGTDAGRERDAGGDNRKELKNSRKEEGEEKTGGLFGSELTLVTTAAPDFNALFQQWYAIYPKKVDPTDAEKAFIRVLKAAKPGQVPALFDQIMLGTRSYVAELTANRTERKYMKAPAVFMNKGSWKSESAQQIFGPARSVRVASALEGMASRLTPEDFQDDDD